MLTFKMKHEKEIKPGDTLSSVNLINLRGHGLVSRGILKTNLLELILSTKSS